MDDNEIIEYFRSHKLNGTGVRNFLAYLPGAREYVGEQLSIHPEYETPGGYIRCIVDGISLPKCVVCGKTIGYRSAMAGHIHCSIKCCSKDVSIHDGRRRTMVERYGVENPGQFDEFKRRRELTIMDRYGVDSILKNPDYVKKQKDTMVKRYGVDSWKKTDVSMKEQYHKSYQTILTWSEYVVPLFDEIEYHGWKHGEVYKWRCVKCGNVFESPIYVTNLHGIERLPRCQQCHPLVCNESNCERELYDFIKSVYEGNVMRHDRNLLDGMEIDIYAVEKKVAFEFDGLFYHNEFCGKDCGYHLGKTEKCEQKGIQLVHIFEDEWIDKREIVEDKVKSILGVNSLNRIFARNCVVAEVESMESNAFLDKNHIQGHDNASIRYGLYHNGELVAVMTFGKPRFNKNYDWELIRYASMLNFTVVGGASKLLNGFRRNHSGSIVSYADRRYSTGNLYKAIGFEHIGNAKPNYCWCKNKVRLSRYQCQKHRLSRILGDKFDSEKSETENMHDCGWSRIYDCGNMIFLKKG